MNGNNIKNVLYEHYKKYQTDNKKQLKLLQDMKKLKQELHDTNINDTMYEDIISNFKIWTKVFNNKIIIENMNMNKIIIKITNRLFINDIDFGSEITNKTSLHFDNCSNLNIHIFHKINHICIVNCSNILVKINKNIISGIDTINSKNITHLFDNDINYLDLSTSHNCKYIISHHINPLLIQTMDSLNLMIIIVKNRKIIKTYDLCKSLLETFNQYKFCDNEIKCKTF
jgi:hypothetical protein